jgi:hypothetical protein
MGSFFSEGFRWDWVRFSRMAWALGSFCPGVGPWVVVAKIIVGYRFESGYLEATFGSGPGPGRPVRTLSDSRNLATRE